MLGHGAAHEELKVIKAFTPLSRATASTTYNLDTAIGDAVGIDLQGFDEALIIVNEGAIAAGASLVYTAMAADVDDAEHASMGVIENEAGDDAAASFADTDDGKIKLIRIRAKDVKRYLFIRRAQTGAFAAVDEVTVILTKGNKVPVTQPTGTTVAFDHSVL